MEKKDIESFLSSIKVDKNTRIERNYGGQYLVNLLVEFDKYSRKMVLKEIKEKIK